MKRIILLLLSILPLISSSQITTYKHKQIRFINYYSDAIKYYLANNYSLAKENLDKALKLNKKSAASYYLYAEIYFKQNNNELAKIYIKKAIKYNKTNIWYKNLLVQILLKEENYSKAEEILKKIIDTSPDIDFFKLLIKIYLKENQLEQAKIYAIKFINNYGYTPQISDVLFYIYKYENDTTNLRNLLDKLIKIYPNNSLYIQEYTDLIIKSTNQAAILNLYKNNPYNENLYVPVLKIYLQKNKIDSSIVITYKIIKSTLPQEIKLNAISLLEKQSTDVKTIYTLYQTLASYYPESSEICNKWLEFLTKNNLLKQARGVGLNCIIKIKNNLNLYKYLDTILALNKSYKDLYSIDSLANLYFPNEPEFYIFRALAALNLKKINESKRFIMLAKNLDISNNYQTDISLIENLLCYLENKGNNCLSKIISLVKSEQNAKLISIYKNTLMNYPGIISKLKR